MDDQGKGYAFIRGEGRAEPSKAKEILGKLLGERELKPTTFNKESGTIIDSHYHTEISQHVF